VALPGEATPDETAVGESREQAVADDDHPTESQRLGVRGR
jgi:hypothetical protein